MADMEEAAPLRSEATQGKLGGCSEQGPSKDSGQGSGRPAQDRRREKSAQVHLTVCQQKTPSAMPWRST